MREDEELKAPRHASAVAIRNGNLLLRDGSLPYLTATCLIPDTYKPFYITKVYRLKRINKLLLYSPYII